MGGSAKLVDRAWLNRCSSKLLVVLGVGHEDMEVGSKTRNNEFENRTKYLLADPKLPENTMNTRASKNSGQS